MAEDPPKLSQAELVKVLQRAAEREGREGPRTFTPVDVLQAGRELGLSPGNVEAELTALVARKSRSSELSVRDRPFDTRISVDAAPDRFVLQVPARGLHGSAVAMLGFSAFWLAFIAYWTYGTVTMGAPTLFSAFSIPFWLVGLGMVGGAVRAMVGTQRLELTRAEGQLSSWPLGRTRKLRTSEVRVRLDRLKQRKSDHGPETELPVLALDHGTKTHHLLAHFSLAEQSWVKAEIEHWLAEAP